MITFSQKWGFGAVQAGSIPKKNLKKSMLRLKAFFHVFMSIKNILKKILYILASELKSCFKVHRSVLLNLKGPCNLGSFFCQKSGRW